MGLRAGWTGFVLGAEYTGDLAARLGDASGDAGARPGPGSKVTGAVTRTASGMQVMQPQTVDCGRQNAGDGGSVTAGAVCGFRRDSCVELRAARGGEWLHFAERGNCEDAGIWGERRIGDSSRARIYRFRVSRAATPRGRTVVEVQSITANGQTIAMNTVPPGAAGPDGKNKGPRDAGGPPRHHTGKIRIQETIMEPANSPSAVSSV